MIGKNRNILVTGGAGYIGSYTCKAFRNRDYLPVSYDNLVYGHRGFVKWGPLEEVISKYRPAAVIHFAAFAYVGESVREPDKYYSNNVSGSITLLNAMKEHGMDKIVFSSTCAVYGEPENVPITETQPPKSHQP